MVVYNPNVIFGGSGFDWDGIWHDHERYEGCLRVLSVIKEGLAVTDCSRP